MSASFPHLFQSGTLGRLQLAHRACLAPMTRISAEADGTPTAQMAEYYAGNARGGFAAILTEGTYTDQQYSMGYAHQPGLATDAHQRGWRRVVEAVHEEGTPIIAQLMHAGALVQDNRFEKKHIAPSAVKPRGEKLRMYGDAGPFAMPIEMTTAHRGDVIEGFRQATRRAVACGFDGVEIHGANGYLLDQFLTVYTNRRDDADGGSLANRLRFPVDVIDAVREAAGDAIVGIRLSQAKVNDPDYRMPGREADAEQIFRTIGNAGVDYIHTCGQDALEAAFGDDSDNLSRLAKRFSGVAVIANGGLHDPERAERLLAAGDADFLTLARGALANPDWPNRVQRGDALREFDPEMLMPKPTLDNVAAWRAKHQQTPA